MAKTHTGGIEATKALMDALLRQSPKPHEKMKLGRKAPNKKKAPQRKKKSGA
jgi:hypothetical protein